MRNPTTWFQLGLIGDAGPEIRNGLGAFLYAAQSKGGCAGRYASQITGFRAEYQASRWGA